MKRTIHANLLLTLLLCAALLALLLLRSLLPLLILPRLKLAAMALMSLAVLLLARILCKDEEASPALDPLSPLFAAASFSLLPFAAGCIAAAELWKYALAGGAMFSACHLLLESACLRLPAGRRRAPLILCALLCFLALQGFDGAFL